jgi:hypothetical protein
MNHIGSVSSGLSSSVAFDRLIKRCPDAIPVFMDTLFEDKDNYRFMDECETRWGTKIVRLTEGRNPYEVSCAERVIPNSRVAPCTSRLKLEPFRNWVNSNFEEATIYIGYDYTEMHRMDATNKAYEELGYKVDYPLLWKPYEFRPYTDVVRSWGIEPPRMYRMGYTHANCGGRCVKQGQGDWLRTLINFPERYSACEEWEQEMRKLSENHSHYAILKRMNGKEIIPLTLQQLREEFESVGEKKSFYPLDLRFLDEQSPCVVCGIGA